MFLSSLFAYSSKVLYLEFTREDRGALRVSDIPGRWGGSPTRDVVAVTREGAKGIWAGTKPFQLRRGVGVRGRPGNQRYTAHGQQKNVIKRCTNNTPSASLKLM